MVNPLGLTQSKIRVVLRCALLFFITSSWAEEYPFQSDPQYVNIGLWPGVVVNLKYSTEDNFLKQDLYGEFNEAWLHREAAAKFKKAIQNLSEECPQCQFIIYDALRPAKIQKQMWDYVVPLRKTLYVANPKKGSVHNFGFAIDLSIVDSTGRPLDMGTPFDSFQPLAQPRYEKDFLKQGRLSQQQINNRHLLKRVMQNAGFYPIFSEWWHFNALPGKFVRKNYPIVE